MMSTEHEEYEEELDARYFQNDIVATAFEIFEKTSNFDAAVNLLMRVIGTRVGLDRITVIRADIKNQEVYSDYQWNKKGIPKVLKEINKFDKKDFLTLYGRIFTGGTETFDAGRCKDRNICRNVL